MHGGGGELAFIMDTLRNFWIVTLDWLSFTSTAQGEETCLKNCALCIPICLHNSLKIFEKVLFSSFKKSPLQSINKKWRSNKLQNMNEFFQTNYWIRSSCNISSCIIADSCIQFILKKMQYVATPTPSPAPPAWCPDFQLWTARVAVSRHLRSFGKNKSHFISLLPLIFDSIHIKY